MADSSSLSHQSKYHVFLSSSDSKMADSSSKFDTRRNFVEHLNTALVRNEIRTFKDDDEEEPKVSMESRLKAIEESRCAIVVFSKSYGASAWCLDELVKIMECNKKIGQFVLPVFYYDFNRSDLRRQGLVFGELFAKSEMEKVRAWSSALVEAANLSGLDLIEHKYDVQHINEILEMVLSNLGLDFNHNARDTTSTHEDLIGIERNVQEVKALLKVNKQVQNASRSVLASSSPPSSRGTYDVFMSFRGNDTCKDFADQLYCALNRKGIYTFSDNQKRPRDRPIASKMLKAIEESSIAMVIFSKNYAASSRCLDTLVKVMNCYEGMGQIILPVYYDVDSSDVRNQKGDFGQVITRYKPEKVEIWRKALVKVGSLSGWYLKSTPKSAEASIIESIVDTISRRLVSLPSSVVDNLIGIERHIKDVTLLLGLKSGGVHMLGIWGMGGVGKTTIARAVFDKLSDHFDTSCFVENIREVSERYGIIHVQEKMLSKLLMKVALRVATVEDGKSMIQRRLHHRMVLIVLDDVNDTRQLEALAGAYDWFGGGSRIIITTNDKHLLFVHRVIRIYNVKPLDNDESVQFLRRHVFKNIDLTEGDEDLLLQVARYANGLPLALKVLGSFLIGITKKEWKSTLARFDVDPVKEIQGTLKTSFDGLEDVEKELFLDIACFFNHTEKDRVSKILDSCGFYTAIGLRVLEEKSFISILDEQIHMHDLLQEMGRDIVRHMHPDEPGKHSRLWCPEEVSDVLMKKTGTEEIRSIVVDNLHNLDGIDMTEVFKGLTNLRLLQIRSDKKSRLIGGSIYLPNKLRWLTWENYPLQSLPEISEANMLVGLELVRNVVSERCFDAKYLWRLEFLDLSYSEQLFETPDFTGAPYLKELKLEYCTSLRKVHNSIGSLKMLTFLSLRGCYELETLPKSIVQLESLVTLNLIDCTQLYSLESMSDRLQFRSGSQMIEIPSTSGNMKNLVELHVSVGKLDWSPSPIGKLQETFVRHGTLEDIVACRRSNSGSVLEKPDGTRSDRWNP